MGFATSSEGSLKNQFIEQANGVGLVVADGFVVVTENTVGVVAVGGKAVDEGFGEGRVVGRYLPHEDGVRLPFVGVAQQRRAGGKMLDGFKEAGQRVVAG